MSTLIDQRKGILIMQSEFSMFEYLIKVVYYIAPKLISFNFLRLQNIIYNISIYYKKLKGKRRKHTNITCKLNVKIIVP